MRQKLLGDDHPRTAEVMDYLGVLYARQSRYEEAEPLLTQSLKFRLAKLGSDHPYSKDSVTHVTELYEAWGKPELAAAVRADSQ